MLAAAFSGIGSQQPFNLPYGEYGMNDPEMDTITHHRLPLTFCLSVNKMIGRKWAVGTGLQYTRLYSETQEGNTYSWTQKEQRLLESDKLRLSPSLQWSIGVAAGVEYRLSPVIGIYAEPSLQYFFKTGDAIDSYRTAHPATFSVPVGIRINIPTPSR